MHACMCVRSGLSVVSDSVTRWTGSPPGSSVLGDSPGKNTGVGCHALLEGIFLGTEPASLMSCALAGGSFTTSATWEAPLHV